MEEKKDQKNADAAAAKIAELPNKATAKNNKIAIISPEDVTAEPEGEAAAPEGDGDDGAKAPSEKDAAAAEGEKDDEAAGEKVTEGNDAAVTPIAASGLGMIKLPPIKKPEEPKKDGEAGAD